MTQLATLPDGRVFPTFDGETLSWSIGLYMTPNEERAGFPRANAVARAMYKFRLEQLIHERSETLKATFDSMFGHNAKKTLKIIDDALKG